eukprot:UN04813
MVCQHNALNNYIKEYKNKHPAHNYNNGNNNSLDEQLIFIQINDVKHDRSYNFFLPRNSTVADVTKQLLSDPDIGFNLTFLPFAPFSIQLLLSTPNVRANCTIDSPFAVSDRPTIIT